jgi:predicted MPP superfamily phosphohydrolase
MTDFLGPNPFTPDRLLAAAVYVAAAACMGLWLASRVMARVRDRRFKRPLAFAGASVIAGIALASGLVMGLTPWLAAPIAALAAAGAFEVRRAVLRRRHRGSAPVHTGHLPVLRRPIGSARPGVTYYRMNLPIRNAPSCRILHVSDLHINRYFPDAWFSEAIDALRGTKPDLLFLTGDIADRKQDIPRVADLLRPLAALGRTFAVLGNHDFCVDAEAVSDQLRKAGATVLRNETRRVTLKTGSLLVSGSEEPWRKGHSWPDPGEPNSTLFVLSHTADHMPRFVAAHADAVFSGHYHAGQIRVPVLGPLIVPSVHGRRFDHGHFVFGRTHLFVSAGIGTEYPPPRVLCRPDVFVLDVQPAPETDLGTSSLC